MIALLGASGMIGSDFEGKMLRPTHEECNALDQNSLYKYMHENPVDTIINCIGF
jgi:dTDP-4-dehydrorhamnose reductase